MVQSLCTHFSQPLFVRVPSSSASSSSSPEHDYETYHPFPPPSALADESTVEALKALGFGYRAKYIQQTAKMLVDAHGDEDGAAEAFLMGLRKESTERAREELLRFMGVGRKVADCVLLMSLDKVRALFTR